ncbi:protease complex subunit PrcB family protein [Prosthecobacter sp.]|uniref:protease complex subunit PrcB family protein n=1 Tax=Prosthecobacter sp. TaxID=1965333 RepID=UPI001D2EFFDB|nr:protease complex subunit PrcB family protein [Prosthecobacter sp.]MCB1279548.1 protease complex subunit PrcB family protein [Prosthecobacter sp.]
MLVCTSVCLSFTARAELPPYVYAEWQAKSPEVLTIQAQEVTNDSGAITVGAKVTAVERSASSLKAGDIIRIGYHSVKQTKPGPSEAAILEKGKSYRAYLSKNETDGDYGLAAKGHSFAAAPVEFPQWHGQYEGDGQFSTELIKTQVGWAGFWERMRRPAPQVLDETKQMAIYIGVGERRTGGFVPKVINATEQDGKLVIVYTEGAPSPESFVTQVITHPWVIAIVPKSELKVEVKKQE